ncbi:MAG: hypothetical protein II857_13090 [Selenomonadaceae bacterium]|nr:hypothetical protein [Selenomonadaceae bacterium]
MDKKKIPEDKIAAEEILKDSELDSIAGGGGQTGVGSVKIFNAPPVLSNPTDNIKYGGQLGSG